MSQLQLRLIIFASFLVTMALLELVWGRRVKRGDLKKRWVTNWGLTLLCSGLLFLLGLNSYLLFGALGEGEFGLLAQLPIAYEWKVLIGFLCLDMLIYWQHRLFHVVPILWKLHKIHHTDRDLDVSSGFRFHPLEIVLSMIIKLTAIWLLGPPILAVFLFEVILSSGALFNHANINLHGVWDRILRLFLITPDMHRIHHSVVINETNSNYGFNLSIWDRIFGSYVAEGTLPQLELQLGINEEQEKDLNLKEVLLLPFKKSLQKNPS